MNTPPLSCLALLLLYISLLQIPTTSTADYPGVIELVGYSNRRARTHFLPSARSGRQLDISTLAPPPAKIQADIETVKQNIEKYNKLLTLDTRNLPESQKDMLERIVERVARLKESLDIEEHAALTQNSTTYTNEPTTGHFAPTTESATAIEPETVPTLVLDETTLLQLQTSMDELAAAQAAVTSQTTRMRELSITTISPELDLEDISAESATEVATDIELEADSVTDTDTDTDTNTDTNLLASSSIAADYGSTTLDSLTDATDPDDQFVAARSNNNIAAITAADSDTSSAHTTTAGSQRTLTTSGKLTKTRATKRPLSSATKSSGSLTTLTKRGQRPGSLSTGHYKQTTTKQKVSAAAAAAAAYTTQQPLQYQKQHSKPHQQQQQHNYQHKLSTVAGSPVTSSTPADQRITSGSTAANYGSTNINTNTNTNNYNSNYNTNSNNNNNNINNNNNNNNNDMVYDAHVNTSAIIDSLNSNAREEYYQQKQSVNNKDKKPSATAKPTKYHYYPHNQHIYLLPECAIQQVCNAVYVRLNYTQPLCACPSRYRDPCSASLNEDDQHTTKLIGDGKKKQAITLAKTCEATTEMRECRSPKDWSLLALQNTRTGKSHYLVICRCPDHFKMEGPMAHDQPTYASVPGIRVFGMMCVKPGYSVRKPSAQPPKRYQLQKPFYRPQNVQSSSSSFLSNSQFNNKDNYGRPTYGLNNGGSSSSSNYHGQDIYSNQHQSGYQYLNRPESSHSSPLSSSNYRPESINNFQNGIYGRNNERKGATSIEAATEEDNKSSISTSTLPTEEARTTMTAADSEINSSSSAADLGVTISADSSTTIQSEENKREKRSLAENTIDLDDDTPEFPWDRVLEFQQTIVWD
ncbi:putative uncharacterized protein DDB_G0277255 [Teleopsis dalmanni]|uniref:putative uncharacterized protein DDB_G0277255 n=1 Tax=Teleopsis dalmanni TaxID=139649 RepID=UPI0018CDA461|nr:putative uncharacterized protein DDB_G0277255 [Teleopsis dalmanni]